MKVVELLREQFQQLLRNRRKGDFCFLVVCRELLSFYFDLDQPSQGGFLLKNLTHGRGDLDLRAPPKALAVSLCFLWGKHSVLEGNIVDAEERLAFAWANCHPEASRNLRRILTYLVPCRLRMGRLPSRSLLERHGLHIFCGLTRAIATGNVSMFNEELQKHELRLMHLGTYVVVEKLKLLVYQKLCCQVHRLVAARLEAAGKKDKIHQQSLAEYERAFAWQDGCDSSETVGVLSNLIYRGAIRGYISEEHQKLVFSKDTPFPSAASWAAKI